MSKSLLGTKLFAKPLWEDLFIEKFKDICLLIVHFCMK